jgi:hypothetical protein
MKSAVFLLTLSALITASALARNNGDSPIDRAAVQNQCRITKDADVMTLSMGFVQQIALSSAFSNTGGVKLSAPPTAWKEMSLWLAAEMTMRKDCTVLDNLELSRQILRNEGTRPSSAKEEEERAVIASIKKDMAALAGHSLWFKNIKVEPLP